jgi:hypothetical protein
VKRAAVVAAAAIAIAAGIAFVADPRDDPYADLRLRSAQSIPGALGFVLEPPPDGTRAAMSPAEAQRRYPAGDAEVDVGFGVVRDTLMDLSIGPGWVLVARGVCLRDSKGELVSDARGTDPLDLECTDATMWILAVDPETGEPLVALTGYDPEGTFHLDVGSA